MGIFLGFGNTQLRQSMVGNHLAENIFQSFRPKHGFHEAVVVNRIFGQTDSH